MVQDKEIQYPIFLFHICIGGLSASLIAIERQGIMFGIKIKRTTPPIFHLLLADDCYTLYRVEMKEIQYIIDCLTDSNEASGKTINHEKLEIFFSYKTPIPFKRIF